MPKLYEYAGMRFSFFANDHKPIHLHVEDGDVKAKAIIERGLFGTRIEWKWLRGKLKHGQQVKAEKLLRAKVRDIERMWDAFHDQGIAPNFERINRLK